MDQVFDQHSPTFDVDRAIAWAAAIQFNKSPNPAREHLGRREQKERTSRMTPRQKSPSQEDIASQLRSVLPFRAVPKGVEEPEEPKKSPMLPELLEPTPKPST